MALLQQIEAAIPKYYGSASGAFSKRISLTQAINSTTTFKNNSSSRISKPESKAEAKKLAAKKHSESERRRRLRMNFQYATLRNIFPYLIKKDKASLLGESIKRVVELQNKVSKLIGSPDRNEALGLKEEGNDDSVRILGMEDSVFPSESDKLVVSHCKVQQGVVKARMSCEDRAGLISDMGRALSSVKGKVVKAEMVNVGGRTKNVLWIEGIDGGNEGITALRRGLKTVMHKQRRSSYTY